MWDINRWGTPMAKREKKSDQARTESLPMLPKLPPTEPQARVEKLLSVCVDLLELCIEVTGTIDPTAAWLVNHAKDEVTLGVYGVRGDSPY